MKRMHETNGRYVDMSWIKPGTQSVSAIKMGIAAKMPDGSVVYSADKEVLFCTYKDVDGENRWHYLRKPNGPIGAENQFTFDQDVSTATGVMVDIEPYMTIDTVVNPPKAAFINVDPEGKKVQKEDLATETAKRVMIVDPVSGNLTCLGSGFNPDDPNSSSADIKGKIIKAEFTQNYRNDAQQQITQWYKENKASDIYYDEDEDINFAILNQGTEWLKNPTLPKVISVAWKAFPKEVIHKPKMGIYVLPADYLEI